MKLDYLCAVKNFFKYIALFLVFFTLATQSCKKIKDKDDTSDIKGNYFSIRQYGLDQWNNWAGPPAFVIVKTLRKGNEKADSSYTSSDTLNWAPIFKTFFETDISDRKYLGQYKFSQFYDNNDGTHNFFYEANDDDLYTQKLLITIDQYTNKVKGIYIETLKKEFMMGEIIQKLYYRPYHTIQLQKDEKSMLGSKSFSVVQYDFML
jgi:hypothetical protein